MNVIIKRIGIALGFISVGVSMMAPVVAAQPVTFEQVIKPIECIYTTIATGGTPITTTNCTNQPLPVVTAVTVTGTHVHVIGHFVAADTRLLRVWIAGHAYTLGGSSGFTAVGDTWTFDLDMVQAGTYAVTLEAETTNSYLLRNLKAATFTIVKPIDIVTPQPTLPPDVVFGNEPTYGDGEGFSTIPALPGSRDLQTPSIITVPAPSINDYAIAGDRKSPPPHTILTELVVVVVVIIPLAGVCVGLFIRSRL